MGVNDRTATLSRDYRRHRESYNRSSETEFQRSYNAGYDNGRASNTDNDDLRGMSASERRIYDDAYQLGQQDARSGNGANYRRYSNRYSRANESSFQRGYEAGYNNIGRNDRNGRNDRDGRNDRNDRYDNDRYNNDQFDLSRLTPYQRRAYDDGYRLGQQDARSGNSLNYRRYNDRYNSSQESFFQRGYEVGYNGARRY
jgi:hypothetical protein